MNTKFHIFKVVAENLSFTKASERLFISQPAVSKSIRSLEETFKTTLFLRKRNSIELTENGKAFLLYVNRILAIYNEMENRFLHEKNKFPEQIKFGASTTLANYILPKIIAKFRLQYPATTIKIISGNSEDILNHILNQKLDFGITEGKNTNRKLDFRKFCKDEIVLVTNVKNDTFKKGVIDAGILKNLSIIERELGSGTRDIIYDSLKKHGITKLNVVVTLNSTEAIKNYLYHSDHYALISINAVQDDLKNNRLKVVDMQDITIERWFYFVSRTGYQSQLMDYFEKFLHHTHNF